CDIPQLNVFLLVKTRFSLTALLEPRQSTRGASVLKQIRVKSLCNTLYALLHKCQKLSLSLLYFEAKNKTP
ncbi:hypothetical protein, partial [Vibrio sp. 03_296]|uniref:hypothetical protein n=1 Tax=Vibrio sp. 03_296 TaxID=2024409 RepID=UPI002D7F2D1B